MKPDLVIAVDRGLPWAYRVAQSRTDRQPLLELVNELRPEIAHQKLSEQFTGQRGRFPKGRGPGDVTGDLSAGEQRDLKLEQRRRLIKLLAGKIDGVLSDERVVACSLAASGPIHLQLLDELIPSARSKVKQTLALDLTKTEPVKLLSHFDL